MSFAGSLYWPVELPNVPFEADDFSSEGLSALCEIKMVNGAIVGVYVAKDIPEIDVKAGSHAFVALAQFAGWNYAKFAEYILNFVEENFSE